MANSHPPESASAPAEQNVAHAYPYPSKSSLHRLLAVVLLASAIATLYFRSRHPLTISVDSTQTISPKHQSSDSETPTIAVCYTGHIGTHGHVFQQNFDVIRKLDPSAHFYYYVDLQDDYQHERTGASYNHTHEIGALQPVLDLAKAIAVKTFTWTAVPLPSQGNCFQRPLQSENTKHHYTYNYVPFYAAHECYQMIKRNEAATGIKYRWILRLQPNMKITIKLPQPEVAPRVHMSGAAMALIPRTMADAFFDVVNAFKSDCEQLDKMGDDPCRNYSYPPHSVECLLIKWLKHSHIPPPSNGVYVNRAIVYPTDGSE